MTGDEFVFRVKELTPTLYRICAVQLAAAADREDAVQDAIMRAWKSLPRLRDDGSFKPWLIRILINACHDIQKHHRRNISTDSVPEPPLEGASRADELKYALFTLEESLRLPVLLHYIDGYSVRETARMLGITENAVKLRLMRGRKALKRQLMEEVFEQ